MDEFVHCYEMESLQLGVTARKDVVEQLRPLFADGDALGGMDGFLATAQALAARRERREIEDEAKTGVARAPRQCRLVVAGNSTDNFRQRLRNIHVAALAAAVVKSKVTGITAIDWRFNHLGEVEEAAEDRGDAGDAGDTGDAAASERRHALDAAPSLARMLQSTAVYASAIAEVDLRGNRLGGESCRLLCAALAADADSPLRVLNLSGNPLGLAGGHALAELLASPGCRLEQLDIGGTGMEVANLVAISQALRDNTSLKVLNLDNPVVRTTEEETIQHVGKMLQVNATLERLSLAKHQLTDHGAQVLAERLLDNGTLRSLSLRANRIGATGAEAIAALADRHPALEELDLGANRIGDAGARAFARVLERDAAALRVLALCSTYMTDAGLEAIALACDCGGQGPSRLESLLLWGNDFGEASARAFLELCAPGGALHRRGVDTDFEPRRIEGEGEGGNGTVHVAARDVAGRAAAFASPKR